MHWLNQSLIARHICQLWWIDDSRLPTFEALFGYVRLSLNNLRLRAPFEWSCWKYWLLLDYVPPSVLTSAIWQLVGRNLDQALSIRIGNEVTRREDLGLKNRL
ncbi:hypothetical protein IG631_16359 [Alternaria alternata]|nr:hypothetical protein IG631_16359 [Alternaria alternata]